MAGKNSQHISHLWWNPAFVWPDNIFDVKPGLGAPTSHLLKKRLVRITFGDQIIIKPFRNIQNYSHHNEHHTSNDQHSDHDHDPDRDQL